MPSTSKNHHTLIFTIDIARPVSTVFEHLSVPHNFLGLQPLLIEISEVTETIEKGVIVHQYTTTEAFRFFGFVPYHNRIHVTTRLTEPNTRLDTESPGGVTLDVEYHFSASELGTHLQEVLHVRSLPITTGFVLREATKAQDTLLARLKQRLESQAV